MTLQEAYEILGLPLEATAPQAKTAYRRRVAEAHPDRGGDTADFIRIRAAYEIVSAFLDPGAAAEEVAVPPGLRAVIDAIVNDFREQQRWAETQTIAHLTGFERHLTNYLQKASRAELSRFSTVFRESWDGVIGALFSKCNARCDSLVERYETWYTENTQVFFDRLYRGELLRFPLRRRFWEAFLVLGAIAGALSVAVGWGGPWRRWVSVGMIVVAVVIAFFVYRRSARRQRRMREKVEPLSLVVFAMDEDARFPTEAALRRGRRTTAALGLAGMFLGNAMSGGLAVPVVGAVGGAALGGVFDRLVNPTGRMRDGMKRDLDRFVEMARPQLTRYVVEAHSRLLDDLRDQIVRNYQERVHDTVRLITAGGDALDGGTEGGDATSGAVATSGAGRDLDK